jgi:type VI secretion system protein ImpK
MPEQGQNLYPLLRQFREFYAEVARLREMVENDRLDAPRASSSPATTASLTAATQNQGGLPFSSEPEITARTGGSSAGVAELDRPFGDDSGQDPDHPEDAVTLRVWNEMAHYLDQRMYEVKHASSSFTHDLLLEMTYILAAFADETFVCLLDWKGRDYWRDHLMELRLFRSQIAGQEIFRRIDNLSTRQDHGVEDISAVYLMILALGFKGKFLRDSASADAYRRQIFDQMTGSNPALRAESRHLFPEASRYTVTEGAPMRLPEPRKWWLIVGLIVVAWLIVSSATWYWITRSTRAALGVTIQSLNRISNQKSLSAGTEKWREVPLALQDGTFQLPLAPPLPLNRAAAGGDPVIAPLLLAVHAGSSDAGAASRIRMWLSKGMIVFLPSASGIAPSGRRVAYVDQLKSTPDGITADGTTLFFLVDTSIDAQELAHHPQLRFAMVQSDGVATDAVTLYLPDRSVSSGQ